MTKVYIITSRRGTDWIIKESPETEPLSNGSLWDVIRTAKKRGYEIVPAPKGPHFRKRLAGPYRYWDTFEYPERPLYDDF
jgi:hypothetical protein